MASKWFTVMAAAVIAGVTGCAGGQPGESVAQQSLRLYVFDCGTLHYSNADAYQLKREEVARTDMSMG